MDFILNNLPIIICVVVGIILLIVEAFMPGFGIPGVSGIVLLIAAVYMTWTDYGSLAGLGVTVAILALAGISVSLALKSASSGRLSRSSLILQGTSSKEEGYKASDNKEMLMGNQGITQTVLRPSGIADLNGQRLNVVSRGEFIDKNVAIQVVEVEGARIVVEKIEA